jgi:Predicted membrane protein
MNVVAMLVWTGVGALLLFGLMFIDALFTKYKDITEIRNGNVAVSVRFVMKLFAQGYILSQSIMKSNDLWQALLVSVVSFAILFVLEMIVEIVMKKGFALDLDLGTQQGKVAYALLAGSLHVVGALILGAL